MVATRGVIAADGVRSALAEAVGIKFPATVPVMQAKVRLPTNWDPTITKCWFQPAETRFFYWLIPESGEKGVVGLIAAEPDDIAGLLDSFLHTLNLTPLSVQYSQVAMHQPGLRPYSYIGSIPVVFVGDAAGQVKVTTVGGTVTGLRGAAAAAGAILNDVPYRETLRPLNRELDLHWLLRSLLDRLDEDGYRKLFSCINPRVQQHLRRHTRDDMSGVIWQLPFLQPRFIPLGIKLLLRPSRKSLLAESSAKSE